MNLWQHRKQALFWWSAFVITVSLASCRPEAGVTTVPSPPITASSTVSSADDARTAGTSPTMASVAAFADPDPSVFVKLVTAEPTTLDPALAYDLGSSEILQNVLEGLITHDPSDPNAFLPALAEAVPSVANGLISADGLTYTFPIRRDVTFHDGGVLEAGDVAYSIRRGLLQSDPTGPQWMLIQPILGYESGDVTAAIAGGSYAGDPDGLRANATAEELAATCDAVMAAVRADDAASTVTITLAQPWASFLALLPTVGIVDQEWAMAQGDWSGQCDDWAEHYAPGPSGSPLNAIANGTGPYRLTRWTPGEEITLTAFADYWRTEATPLGDDGPFGPARIPTVIIRVVEEWGTRLAALQAGDADYVEVPFADRAQVEALVGERCDYATSQCQPDADHPQQPLRLWDGLPTVQRSDIFMNQAVAAGSPYLGSGRLDGNGIPPDFFADINVRRAMATCFDYDTYNADLLLGQGVRNNGPIIRDMLGYNPDGQMVVHDREACARALAEAWDGALPEVGFRLPFIYSTVMPGGAEVAGILAGELAAVNPKYILQPVELPWPVFLEAMNARQLPIFRSGWIEDYHDPHAWAEPFTVGSYGAFQGLPEELSARFAELVAAGVGATDVAARQSAYFELQRLFYENVPTLILAQRPTFRVEPRWVQGFAYRVGMSADSPLYYTLWTE